MAPGMIPVRVAIRVRPLSGKERQEGCENALKVVDGRPQVAKEYFSQVQLLFNNTSHMYISTFTYVFHSPIWVLKCNAML